MLIKLKNVGCIGEATVELTGLNVIAGENGTGKSTVGKTVYAVIRAINEYESIVLESKKLTINSICRHMFFSIQNNLKTNNPDVRVLMKNFNKVFFEYNLIKHLEDNEYEEAKKLINSNIEHIDSFVDLNDKTKSSVKNSLTDLESMFCDVNENNDATKQSLIYMYDKMFKNQINNLKTHETSEILFDNNGYKFEYQVSNNSDVLQFPDRLKMISVDENFKQSIFPRVTFIETALVLQLAKNSDLPFLWIDLINKLKNQECDIVNSDICKKIHDELSEILGGELLYAEDIQNFYFRHKGLNNRLFVNNMASGEKMLAILQKMAKLGLLSPDHLLIIDEPENHLHPQWQVKLAEILISLAENDVPILLTTHSAKLIGALQQWAESKEVSDKVKFYFAKKNGNEVTIENVDDIDNGDKNPIFESFYNANKFLPD